MKSFGPKTPVQAEIFDPLSGTPPPPKEIPFDGGWDDIIQEMDETHASDIHFADGKIFFRADNELDCGRPMDKSLYEKTIFEGVPTAKQETVTQRTDIDAGVEIQGRRFRVNVYNTFHGLQAAFRPLPTVALTVDESGFSTKIVNLITSSRQGLVLVTGPTGSGKSTAICSLLHHINMTSKKKIITIEDPIEHVFRKGDCIVAQREIGVHCESFRLGLRGALRQNPDIIFFGEMRDPETASAAIHAATTGHLVFTTMHTMRVHSTIESLVSMYPSGQRDEIRTKISMSLLAVICQRLISKKNGGRIPCREILINNPASASSIMGGQEKNLVNIMAQNLHEGMMPWEKALDNLEGTGLFTNTTLDEYRDKQGTISI